MESISKGKRRLAVVFGTIPSAEDIDQFYLISENFDVTIISTRTVTDHVIKMCNPAPIKWLSLADYDENTSYLPGLEQALSEFDIVIVKERVGLYAYQALKAKWKYSFQLCIWVDNLTPFPADDIAQLRTIREEVTAGADRFLVGSNAARRILLQEGIEDSRIAKFRPWVRARVARNTHNKNKSYQLLGIKEGDFTIVYVGQIEWEEGLMQLLHGAQTAIQTDASMNRRLRIAVCGVGEYMDELRKRAAVLGISDRVIHVSPTRDAYDAMIAAADCLYVSTTPSRDWSAGDPYRFLLAMVNKIPVLASRSSIVEEFVGKHRIDFCPGSAEGLARSIRKIATESNLVKDLVEKNYKEFTERFADKVVRAEMIDSLNISEKIERNASSISTQLSEIESKIAAKQYVNAVDLIESVFSRKDIPSHVRSNLFRMVGDCFTRLGDAASGKDAYLQSIELDAYSSRAYIGLGTIALVNSSFDLAIVHFQKAVTLAPRDEMVNFGLGLAFQGLGENKEAVKWITASLNINPANSAAIYSLVKIAYDTNDLGVTIQPLQHYLNKLPEDFDMKFTLGGILFRLGRFEETRGLMDDILAKDPSNARARSLMHEVRQKTSNTTAEAVQTGR